MWNIKCFVIPVITEATGTVTKGLRNIWNQYQESIEYIPYTGICTRDIPHNKESATM
jgi:hypothetical protein